MTYMKKNLPFCNSKEVHYEPTNRRTDRPIYRDARMHLKTGTHNFWMNLAINSRLLRLWRKFTYHCEQTGVRMNFFFFRMNFVFKTLLYSARPIVSRTLGSSRPTYTIVGMCDHANVWSCNPFLTRKRRWSLCSRLSSIFIIFPSLFFLFLFLSLPFPILSFSIHSRGYIACLLILFPLPPSLYSRDEISSSCPSSFSSALTVPFPPSL